MVYLSQAGLRTERVELPQSSPLTSAPKAMGSQNILLLARQGDPKVIAALMNHTTRARGIVTHVVRRDACLYVLLEAEKIPHQQMMVNFVRDGLQRLAVESIDTIKVYGRRIGENTVAWNHEIQLQPGHTSESSLEIQVTQDPQPSSDPQIVSTDVAATSPATPTSEQVDQTEVDDASQAIQADQFQAELSEADVPLPDFSEAAIDSDWLERPEALVLIVFASLFILWQVYLDLLEEADSEGFSNRKLAQRLGVSYSTIIRRKEREDFSTWSQNLDPDGIAWVYADGKFVPQP